jgi:hypothetical protein
METDFKSFALSVRLTNVEQCYVKHCGAKKLILKNKKTGKIEERVV